MADRVHPIPAPPSRRPDHQQPSTGDADTTAAAPTETTPLQQEQPYPSFNQRPLSPPPGTYIVQIPKDQVLRVPPPDRARRYKKLAARPARRRLLRRACCFSLAAVLLLILLAAAFVGAVYLIFRPRSPTFSVSSLSIHGLDTLSSSSSSSSLSPELDAAVRADNGRNRRVIIDYRGGGSVTVSYAGERLATGPWPAFRQAARNVTVFAVAMRGNGVRLTEEQTKQLAAEQAAGDVPMVVEAVVPVRLRFGGTLLRTWTVDVKATCDVAVDRLAANATAVNRGCKVKVKPLWWWW
ncbi:hypothetical protein HU200_049944 [Digitaria exilis]|uniref:Late embryogenesis abundant protein LEA-2 subgroup domain-containing protein n=1 Tax=Digitaria exilis TaxID=1010633 RepID=A0A835ASG5_9POAL|nr:hypothetical protein HU200_049944 [Digitaria exilis]CAB3488956.1 unnamed protein product [Digitaria exilis]